LKLVKYIIRRMLFAIILITGVATMVFIVSHLLPSDPVSVNLSPRSMSNPEIVEAFRVRWGLDKPLHIQYLLYMKDLLKGDLGTSIRTSESVSTDIFNCLFATIELAFSSIIFASVFGILFGMISAIKRNSAIDHICRTISVIGVSIPSFWFAIIILFVFYHKLGWAPGPGRISSFIEPPTSITNFYLLDSILQGNWVAAANIFKHLIAPTVVLGAFNMGFISRITRSSLLNVLSADYIRTAKAKGLPGRLIMFRHAFRNALIPVLTVIGFGLSGLLGGMVLVENIFAWPGLGQYAYFSIIKLDFPAITGVALIIAINYLFLNLSVDILYGLIDPRVKYE